MNEKELHSLPGLSGKMECVTFMVTHSCPCGCTPPQRPHYRTCWLLSALHWLGGCSSQAVAIPMIFYSGVGGTVCGGLGGVISVLPNKLSFIGKVKLWLREQAAPWSKWNQWRIRFLQGILVTSPSKATLGKRKGSLSKTCLPYYIGH